MTNRVNEIRKMRGMSQSALAEGAGTSNVQISRIESGDRKLNEDFAERIARVLQVQPGDLMPIITDGSVPMPGEISQYELSVLMQSFAAFMEIHTDHDRAHCERLAMAAVKKFQIDRDAVSGSVADQASPKGKQPLDQSST